MPTPTKASIALGSKFSIGNGATPTEAFTDVAEVIAIKGLKLSANQVEATHLGSTGGFKEFIAGLKDIGSVTITFNYVAGGSAETAFMSAFNAGTVKNYRITFPNNATWTFPGVLTEFSPADLEVDKKMEGTVVIKPSGAPTIVAGT